MPPASFCRSRSILFGKVAMTVLRKMRGSLRPPLPDDVPQTLVRLDDAVMRFEITAKRREVIAAAMNLKFRVVKPERVPDDEGNLVRLEHSDGPGHLIGPSVAGIRQVGIVRW